MRFVIAIACLFALFAVDVDAKCGGGSGRVNRREARRMARNGYGVTVVHYQSYMVVPRAYVAPVCESHQPKEVPVPKQLPAKKY